MKPMPPISPVFGRRHEMAAFIVFGVLSLVAPLAAARMVPVEKRYESVPWTFGDYTFIREEIFGTGEPIDILFLGSSSVWTGVNAVLVEEVLEERLRRPATVLNFGVTFPGHEASYFLLRDTLSRRPVKLVVLGAPSAERETPHRVTPYLLDLSRDRAFLRTLPAADLPTFYASTLLGAPRQLLSMLRPNRGLVRDKRAKSAWSKKGNGQHHDTVAAARSEDALAGDHSGVSGAASAILLGQGDARIRAAGELAHQTRVLRAIHALCEQSGAKLVLLRMPRQDDDGGAINLPDGDLLDGRLQVIAPFSHATLGAQERRRLFRDPGHLNYRGSISFTREALPALLQVYEQPSH